MDGNGGEGREEGERREKQLDLALEICLLYILYKGFKGFNNNIFPLHIIYTAGQSSAHYNTTSSLHSLSLDQAAPCTWLPPSTICEATAAIMRCVSGSFASGF